VKIKKIIKRTVLVILIVIAGFVGAFAFMVLGIQHTYNAIEPLKLDQTADGTYSGKGGGFIVSAKLDVTVKNHRIEDIQVIRQVSGSGYEALDTIPRILEKQEAKVDAVSGATYSSKAIMSAVYDALDGNE
jgi:uncharacterized protein with FMN-binding domain